MTRIVYCDDTQPGITRHKARRGWAYHDADGARIGDREEIDRLNGIGLPPAYRDAWFCPDPRGHIQAVGRDDRGRKQYRYHPDFRAALALPRATRYLDRYERGLIAFLKQGVAPDRKAA